MGTAFIGTSTVALHSNFAGPIGRAATARRAAPEDARVMKEAVVGSRTLSETEVVAAAVADVASNVRGALGLASAPVLGAAAVGLAARAIVAWHLRSQPRRKWRHVVSRIARPAEPDKSSEDEEFNLDDLVSGLIAKSRTACELGIDTLEWHEEMFDDAPAGYREALSAGIEIVDVKAGSDALRLLARANAAGDLTPLYNLRISPAKMFGLTAIMNTSLTRKMTILNPLEKSLRALKVGCVETLTLHVESGGCGFPTCVYDAVAEAYQKGMISRVGVYHPNASQKALTRIRDELQNRGVLLSCVFVRLNLLDRKALPLIEECKDMGLQVMATEALGEDELASGRYTASNPTGGEIGLPRFTLAQLMPLRPFHMVLENVATRVRTRINKSLRDEGEDERQDIDCTQVALQWCASKGASPLCDTSTEENTKALIGCKDWTLTPDEVEMLDKAADELPRRRR